MSYHTAQKPILLKRGRKRKKRPKTFKTEASAKAWAEANKIKNYEIEDLKASSKVKKLRIVVK